MRQKLLRLNPEAALLDSRLDSAIIGLGRAAFRAPVAIYSKKAIYAILIGNGLSAADVPDYYQWHVLNLNAGDHTLIVFDDMTSEDI
jgi:hypothetical protein